MSLSLIAAVPFQVGTDFQWWRRPICRCLFSSPLGACLPWGCEVPCRWGEFSFDLPLTHYRPFNEFSLGPGSSWSEAGAKVTKHLPDGGAVRYCTIGDDPVRTALVAQEIAALGIGY